MLFKRIDYSKGVKNVYYVDRYGKKVTQLRRTGSIQKRIPDIGYHYMGLGDYKDIRL